MRPAGAARHDDLSLFLCGGRIRHPHEPHCRTTTVAGQPKQHAGTQPTKTLLSLTAAGAALSLLAAAGAALSLLTAAGAALSLLTAAGAALSLLTAARTLLSVNARRGACHEARERQPQN